MPQAENFILLKSIYQQVARQGRDRFYDPVPFMICFFRTDSILAVVAPVVINDSYFIGDREIFQLSTAEKRLVTDGFQSLGDIDRSQIGTPRECFICNDGYTVWENDTDQTATAVKCIGLDGRYPIRKYHIRQIFTSKEDPWLENRYPLCNHDISQIFTKAKGIGIDFRDTTWDMYTGQTVAVRESPPPNGTHLRRDSYLPIRTDVSGQDPIFYNIIIPLHSDSSYPYFLSLVFHFITPREALERVLQSSSGFR